jgi:hypothetical protein
MSNRWDEYARRVQLWQEASDLERLDLPRLYHDAWACHETDPERSVAQFTRGRDEARRLNEPWWELFFESWRLTGLTSHLMDFKLALPLAVELMVRFQSPDGRAHPDWLSVLTNVLYTYINVDPFGYSEEIERGFDYMDGEVPRGPVSERFVLNHRWICYLSETDRWAEAYELAMRSVALADQARDASVRNWHGPWALYELCRICAAMGRLEELADHAEYQAELSERHGQLRRTRADAWIWRAVTRRAAGDERDASSSFHRGMALLDGLERCDSICADPIARYYELGGDLKATLGIRDRELAEMTRKGRLHRACQLQIERCRLLSQLSGLKASDLDAVRQSASQLRIPDRYLERLARLELTGQTET